MNNENAQTTARQASRAMSFEEAMDKLEQLVRSMESGNTKLEDMIQRFVEARKLSAYCQSQLNSLKEKIEILTSDDPNNPRYQEFHHDSENRADFIPGKPEVQASSVDAAKVQAGQEPSAQVPANPGNEAPQAAPAPVRRRSRVHAAPQPEEQPSAKDGDDEFLLF